MQEKKVNVSVFSFPLSNSAILNTYAEDIWLKNGSQAWTGRSNVCNARNISRMPHHCDGSMSSADGFLLYYMSLSCVTNLWQDTVLWMPLLRCMFTWRTPGTLSPSSPTLAVHATACLLWHTVVSIHLSSPTSSYDESCHDAVPCPSWCLL